MEGKEKKKERSNFWKQQENLCLKMETKVYFIDIDKFYSLQYIFIIPILNSGND